MTSQTVSQAVAKRDEETGPVTLMWRDKPKFAAVLPKSVDVDAFMGTMAGALYANKELHRAAKMSPDSLFIALMKCAALGHMPGTDEYYLTPRKDKGVPKVLGIEGYRGVIERMYRSGAVAKVVVREVCAKDPFEYVEGEMDKPVHSIGGKPAGDGPTTGADFFGATGSRDRGEMVGVYAYAELTNGAVSRVVLLSRDDVHAARDSGGYKPDDQYTPWNRLDGGKDHLEFKGRSMWWKTAAKRLEPWVPTSAEYRREMLRASSAAAEAASARYVGAVIPEPGSTPVPVTAAQAAQLAEQGIGLDIHDAEIVDELVAERPCHPALAAEINGHFKQIGFTAKEREQVLAATATLAGRDDLIDRVDDLTEAEATRVKELLETCGDRAALVALLAGGAAQDNADA
jgi:recombination protein RecT